MSAVAWLVGGWIGFNVVIAVVAWLCRDDEDHLDVDEVLERSHH